jgi:transcriptional regulator with XRE-family HTH domain
VPRPIVIVDPSFGERMHSLRVKRGLSFRELGKLASYSHTTVWEIEQGRKQPGPDMAARLDMALDAAGQLAALVTTRSATAPIDPDEEDRLINVARRPRAVDQAALRSLAVILGEQRRLEDAVGSSPLLAPVAAQLTIVESLVVDARGPLRPAVLDDAAQWAQFLGWLSANTHHDAEGRSWYERAMHWATEAGDANMVATALNMLGHLEWLAGNVGPVIGLSQAAGRQAASPGVLALAAQQEARGHALAGEPDDTDRMLDLAVSLATEAAEHPENEPPWIYFHNPDYLTMQRGLAYRYLGRHREAIDLLTTGLDAMSPDMRRSEWVGVYVYQLARIHADLGDRDTALARLAEVEGIATETGSERLKRLASGLRQRLDAVG